MINFISASMTNQRFSNEHSALRDDAITKINEIIRKAREFPIVVPRALFTDIESVKYELLRKLREESGWQIAMERPETIVEDGGLYVYINPPYRREETKK